MAGLLSENEAALQKAVAADFKTASQEFVFRDCGPAGRNAIPEEPAQGLDGTGGAAQAKARNLALNISVTVCDADGRLVAFQRMDGTFAEASRTSIGKAIASVSFGRPSGSNFRKGQPVALVLRWRNCEAAGKMNQVTARPGCLFFQQQQTFPYLQVELNGAAEMLEKLRHGGLRGKAVIRP